MGSSHPASYIWGEVLGPDQAGADVKENLKNWAKAQEAELAEARLGFALSTQHGFPTWYRPPMNGPGG